VYTLPFATRKSTILCVIALCLAVAASAQFEDYTTDQFLSSNSDHENPDFIHAMAIQSFEVSAVNTDTAVMIGTRALKLAELADLPEKKALSHVVLGIAYQTKADYYNALKSYLEALSIYELLGMKKLILRTRSRCANVYQDTEQHEKALAIRLQNIEEMDADMYLGYEYSNTGKIYESLNSFDTADYYYKKGLKLFQQLDTKTPGVLRGEGVALRDLAGIRYHKGEPDAAIQYANASIEILQQLNSPYEVAIAYLILIKTFRDQKADYGQAQVYAQKMSAMANLINAPYLRMDLYEEYSKLFELKGEYKSSLEAYKKHVAARDSIFAPKELIGLALLQADIQKSESQMGQPSRWRPKDFLLLGVGLILLLLLFYRYRPTREG